MRITALLTCFNRRESTLRSLACLREAADTANLEVSAVLVDDGSTDGTADAVCRQFDWVRVLPGDGSMFWTRGMHKAMAAALQQGPGDALLWLNDDTYLAPDALVRMWRTAEALRGATGRDGIVVGATQDDQGRLSYSGCVAPNRWRAFQFRKVFDAQRATDCETMNGNVVLIPDSVARKVGNLDPCFEHAMGDIDYGLRARRAGVPLQVAPGFVGQCRNNPLTGSFMDPSLPLRRRWQLLTHRKALPPRSWLCLTRKHGGLLWPMYFAWPYASFFPRAWWAALRRPPV